MWVVAAEIPEPKRGRGRGEQREGPLLELGEVVVGQPGSERVRGAAPRHERKPAQLHGGVRQAYAQRPQRKPQNRLGVLVAAVRSPAAAVAPAARGCTRGLERSVAAAGRSVAVDERGGERRV